MRTPTTSALEELQKLRKFRGPRVSALGAGAMIERIATQSQKTRRKLGQVIDLWQAFVPENVAAETRIVAFNRGTLHVQAPNSSVRYEVDRLLREGLEQQLRASFRGTLRGVKVRVGEVSGARW
jgi:hypothetical protein